MKHILPILMLAIIHIHSIAKAFTPIPIRESASMEISMPTMAWYSLTPYGIEPNGVNVYDILTVGDDTYVAGVFWTTNFENTYGVFRWDGCSWALLPGITGVVKSLAVQGAYIFAGGNFQDAGGHPEADNIAIWNGSTWNPVGNGLNGTVNCLVPFSGGIVAAGTFINAGGNNNADRISLWNGGSWQALGQGLDDQVVTLAASNGKLYAGGWFTNAGGNPAADYLAEWNGAVWNSLGPGVNGSVYSLATDGNDIYAAGWFSINGGNGDGAVFRWNGTSWLEIESIPTAWYYANTIAINNDYLYATFTVEWGPQFLRYNLTNDTWEVEPPGYPGWEFISSIEVNNEGIWVGSSGVDGGDYGWNGCLHRWGEPIPTYSISGVPGSICQDAQPISLPTLQGGYSGIWSGPGVTNNTFDPSDQWGLTNLTFTPDPSQCVGSVTVEINVYLNQTTLALPNSICGNAPDLNLELYQNGLTGLWTGPGVSNNQFDPSGLSGNITLLFTPDAGQCIMQVSGTIHVITPAEPVTTIVPEVLCEFADPVELPGQIMGITGNWIGDGVASNWFFPAGLSGSILLTFIPSNGECAEEFETDILVDPEIVITIAGVPETICQLSGPVQLPAIQSGIPGNWSGTGVTNNIFNPENLNGTVTLHFTPLSGYCAFPASFTLEVYYSTPDISGLPSQFCQADPPFTLPTLLNGIDGSWTGAGVSNNTFIPTNTTGMVILDFIPSPGQCAIPAELEVNVAEFEYPDISQLPSAVCASAFPIELPSTVQEVSGTWTGPGVEGTLFNPMGMQGFYDITFTPFIGECAAPATWNVHVDTSFIPAITDLPVALCQSDQPIALALLQGGFTGSWSGPGIAGNIFNPATLSGVLPFMFVPDSNQCAVPTVINVSVDVPFQPVLVPLPDSLCQNDDPIYLDPIQNGIIGTWEGPGVDSSYFTPAIVHGNILLSFVAYNGACEDTTSTQLFVKPLPHYANLSISCDSVSNTYVVSFTISGGDTTGYLVDGNPISGGNFTSDPIPFTSQFYSFTLEDGSDCVPVVIAGSNSCICATQAGTMDFTGTPLRVCRGPRFSVAHLSDHLLDPDDLLGFVMHDQSGNSLGNVFAYSDQPIFTFLPGMVIGQTYFISALAGTNTGSGTVDLQDPCLSVSPGVPVVFSNCRPDDPKDDPAPPDTIQVDLLTEEGEVLDQFMKDEKDVNGSGQPVPFRHSSTVDIHVLQEIFNSISQEGDVTIKAVNIYDVYGRLVHQDKNHPLNQVTLASLLIENTLNLIPGYYILTAEIDIHQQKSRFVLKKYVVTR